MKIDNIEIDELWFAQTDSGSLQSLLYFVVDNPLGKSILNTYRGKLARAGELSSKELSVAGQIYKEYKESCETLA